MYRADKVWSSFQEILEKEQVKSRLGFSVQDLRHCYGLDSDEALDLKSLVEIHVEYPVPTMEPTDDFGSYMSATVHDCDYEGWSPQDRITIMKLWCDYNLFLKNR